MAFVATEEQKAIIESELKPQCVIACAGSGKTATAVRRMIEISKQCNKSYVALLSYSNVAVETFRKEYSDLAPSHPELSGKVMIATMDSFIASNILLPHAYRTMKCTRQPFLVSGHESFLNGVKVFNGNHNVGIEHLQVRIKDNKFIFEESSQRIVNNIDSALATKAIRQLGSYGAYTYNLGRYWALLTLITEVRLIEILARRYQYILVDEAQDIGTMHQAILNLLIEAGSKLSLIGDPNQAIFEFANADGSYIQNYHTNADTLKQPITQNRRSIKQIVEVANSITGNASTSVREAPARKHGAFLLKYKNNNLEALTQTIGTILKANNYSYSEAAILCRGNALLEMLTGGITDIGQGATEQFASAAIYRDRNRDISSSFKFALNGILKLFKPVPDLLHREVINLSDEPEAKALRILIWHFIKSLDNGLPSSTLPSKDEWLPHLKKNLAKLIENIEASTTLKRSPSWGNNVTKAQLSDAPLYNEDFLKQEFINIRTHTVHQVKGESIEAVFYVVKKTDLDSLLNGTNTEDGRIGYVAITRAKDLLVLCIPDNTKPETILLLQQKGFIYF